MTLLPALLTRRSMASLGPGSRLGRYELLRGVARGGMASVWAAREHGADGGSRLVAVKMVLPELADPEFEGMFLEEARLAARIHHPNVCEIFELIDQAGVLALVMEWVDGDTLAAVLAASGQQGLLDRRVSARIVSEVAAGLHAAHELRNESGVCMRLVHRDVSPQNILIARDGRIKVTDFGIAKALGRAHSGTAVGTVKGKLGYMSPEQAEGRQLDRRSDLFSLGVILYTATVGVHPFRRAGETRKRQFMRLLSEPVTPPSELAANYPEELASIVLRSLSRDPAQRFATAKELELVLRDWILSVGPMVSDDDVALAIDERIGPPRSLRSSSGAAERPTIRPRRALPARRRS